MASLPITLKKGKAAKTVSIEVDARRFERLAATFGFFRKEFLQSLNRAFRDSKQGRVRIIRSFDDLD